MLKNPQVERFDCVQQDVKFWCYCCQTMIEKNVTDGNTTVLYAGLIEHMATQEHRKNTHKFWWENNVDQKLRGTFIFSSEETDRFKTEVEKVLETFDEKEDELIKKEAEFIRAQEEHRREFLESLTEQQLKADFESLNNHNYSNISAEEASSESVPMGATRHGECNITDSVTEVPYATAGLTFIGHQDSSSSGNIHTGAIPPWLQEEDDPLEGGSGLATQLEIGPSLQGFLKHKEQEKLKKLPPNRVGANFDHSSKTDANWLPSFGRVWNSGRRWQSRHQFRQEEGQKNKRKRKREDCTDET